MNIDWHLLVIKLGTKKPLTLIAKDIGVHPNVLHRYSSGVNTGEPKFSTGLKLLDVYYDYFEDMSGVRL